MAALSDIDLIRILGEDARAQINAASEKSDDPAIARKKMLVALEGQQFTAFALILMGLVLFVSAYYTQTGTSFTVQCYVAGLAVVGGFGWNLYLGKRKKNL